MNFEIDSNHLTEVSESYRTRWILKNYQPKQIYSMNIMPNSSIKYTRTTFDYMEKCACLKDDVDDDDFSNYYLRSFRSFDLLIQDILVSCNQYDALRQANKRDECYTKSVLKIFWRGIFFRTSWLKRLQWMCLYDCSNDDFIPSVDFKLCTRNRVKWNRPHYKFIFIKFLCRNFF